jgi:putative hydrolase of the HAD superfamily
LLEKLKYDYRLVVATKGDLLDQQRKLKSSGLMHHFHHIEIMSDKKEENYLHLFQRLDIRAEEFLMVGNSLKSDVLPVISMGGKAVHIPYHITWQHEKADNAGYAGKYVEIKKLTDLLEILPKK